MSRCMLCTSRQERSLFHFPFFLLSRFAQEVYLSAGSADKILSLLEGKLLHVFSLQNVFKFPSMQGSFRSVAFKHILHRAFSKKRNNKNNSFVRVTRGRSFLFKQAKIEEHDIDPHW